MTTTNEVNISEALLDWQGELDCRAAEAVSIYREARPLYLSVAERSALLASLCAEYDLAPTEFLAALAGRAAA